MESIFFQFLFWSIHSYLNQPKYDLLIGQKCYIYCSENQNTRPLNFSQKM